ncbi:MAG: cbb3-type cytochrome c oxidase subunit 3 [Pseudomonadota bacterium]
MELSHDTLVYFSKSWGLFYLIAFSVAVVIYAFWPSKKKTFERAARQVIDDEDRPCR